MMRGMFAMLAVSIVLSLWAPSAKAGSSEDLFNTLRDMLMEQRIGEGFSGRMMRPRPEEFARVFDAKSGWGLGLVSNYAFLWEEAERMVARQLEADGLMSAALGVDGAVVPLTEDFLAVRPGYKGLDVMVRDVDTSACASALVGCVIRMAGRVGKDGFEFTGAWVEFATGGVVEQGGGRKWPRRD